MSIKIYFSQNNLSEARENFFKNKSHRAQKDISEALEQVLAHKNLSEAQRAILTSHHIILALSNRCVQKGLMT